MLPVSFTQAPLILQPSTVHSLIFAPGRVINARVIESGAAGRVSLSLEGQIVQAFSLIDFEPGNEICLQVLGSSDGQVYLKLISEALKPVTDHDLSQLLQSLGVPVTDKTMQIVNQLRWLQLPITLPNIITLQRMNDFWQSPTRLGSLLERIITSLNEICASPPAYSPNTGVIEPLITDEPAGPTRLIFLKNLLERLRAEMMVNLDLPATVGAEQLHRQVVSTPALQALLQMIGQELKESGAISRLHPNLVAKLTDDLKLAVDALTAQQVISSAAKTYVEVPDCFYWQLPFFIPSQFVSVALTIYRDERHQDENHTPQVQVILNLETPLLGRQVFDLKFSEKNIWVDITVENEVCRDLIMVFWPELELTLGCLGYRVALQRCTLGPVPDWRPSLTGWVQVKDWRRLDVTI